MAKSLSINKGGDAELFKKKASFIQHSLPGLPAGAYQLKLQQELQDSKGNLITTTKDNSQPAPLTTITRNLGVKGPKYSLEANAIHSVYPPASSAGGFSNSLAHVVFEQEKLPWIRSPYLPKNVITPSEHEYPVPLPPPLDKVYYEDDQPTWMMVLTLCPSDLGGQDPERLPVTGTVLDLVPESMTMKDVAGNKLTGKLPSNAYSIFSYLLQPPVSTNPVDPEFGYSPSDACTYIDVPADKFNKLVPSLDDLMMMAHVRAVQMDAKPLGQGETVQPVEQYGLVLGNRLPETLPPTPSSPPPQKATAIGKNVAFLVSLEAMELALRGNQAVNNQYPIITANGGFVRLVVLYQWSFTSWADSSFEFEQILKSLNGRNPAAENSKELVANPLLRLPDPPVFSTPTDDQLVLQEMLELGYTPLNHLTRVPDVTPGDDPEIQTVSWYRGPFIPFQKEASIQFISSSGNTQEELIFSADKLLRFDPNVGMYDTSYAAAWQLGQLISLKSKSFSLAYYSWQKLVAQKFRVLLENQVLQDDNADLMALYQSILDEEGRNDTDKTIYKSVLHLLTKS